MNTAIQFNHVSKHFGHTAALDRVSLQIPEGSVFAMLGENGAGKTTAIKIMLGLLEPDAGISTVLGLDSQRDGLEIRKKVGYVPEQPDLYDWMTVEEIGDFTAAFYSHEFLTGYLQMITEFRVPPRQKIKSLSKGMRAKVSLSLALAHDPALLILDEPTSGLDAMVRREFLESMVDRAATGRTVFLSSHQIHEVERVADYVAILREGDLLTVEPLDDLKADCHRLTLTLRDNTTDPPKVPGTILECRDHGRQIEYLLRGVKPSHLATLSEQPDMEQVEITSPNLEEIFIAYMQGNGDRAVA
ncbi:MAG: ABC transporter ATP-binding protein [Planctomycetia bacterium]|jgi:ABC-2 type transport system ATP-binding protein